MTRRRNCTTSMVSRPLKKVQVPEVLMAEARDSVVRVVLAVDLAASARAAAATAQTRSLVTEELSLLPYLASKLVNALIVILLFLFFAKII